MNPSIKPEGFSFIQRKVNMYWLETTNEKYLDCNYWRYHFLPDALIEYNRLIKAMMEDLPEEQWFNLKLFRHRTPDDPVDNKCKSTKRIIVRSWVY